MGTRADFYVGRGKDAEWLGSIAWDGHEDSTFDKDGPPVAPENEKAWRDGVAGFLAKREDGTTPARGWPWPWEDSNTTDFAYAFDGGKVYGTCFGHGWWLVAEQLANPTDPTEAPKSCVFPNMKDGQRVTFGPRSGVIVVRAPGAEASSNG